jgi:hypothetical protein
MITTLLCIALGASDGGWAEVKANGFTFSMPSTPELKNGPVTWPTTGLMTVTEWTSTLTTGDKQIDRVTCYESTVPSLRMVGTLHDKLCKEDAPGQRKFDRTDATTQARECLMIGDGPDGKRRTLVKIVEVGANVCSLSSSAKIDKPVNEPSPQMRRFVDSLKLTGKPTVVSVTPWVSIKGNGFSFELPEMVKPASQQSMESHEGKATLTKWNFSLLEESLNVHCMASTGPAYDRASQGFFGVCDASQGKVVKAKLPTGATECTVTGKKTVLARIFPLTGQICMIFATRDTGEPSQDARRFVESFAKAK